MKLLEATLVLWGAFFLLKVAPFTSLIGWRGISRKYKQHKSVLFHVTQPTRSYLPSAVKKRLSIDDMLSFMSSNHASRQDIGNLLDLFLLQDGRASFSQNNKCILLLREAVHRNFSEQAVRIAYLLFDKQISIPPGIFVDLIRLLASNPVAHQPLPNPAEKIELALSLIDRAIEVKQTMNYNIFVPLLKICGQLAYLKAILRRMEAAYVEITVVTFSTAIKACDLYGNVQQALNMLEYMTVRMRIVPNEIVFCNIINVCVKQIQLVPSAQQNSQLLQSGPASTSLKSVPFMNAVSIQMSEAIVYATVAMNLLREMHVLYNIEPNIQCYGSTIYGCAKAGMWKEIYYLLDEMEKDHVVLNSQAINGLFCILKYHYANHNKWRMLANPIQSSYSSVEKLGSAAIRHEVFDDLSSWPVHQHVIKIIDRYGKGLLRSNPAAAVSASDPLTVEDLFDLNRADEEDDSHPNIGMCTVDQPFHMAIEILAQQNHSEAVYQLVLNMTYLYNRPLVGQTATLIHRTVRQNEERNLHFLFYATQLSRCGQSSSHMMLPAYYNYTISLLINVHRNHALALKYIVDLLQLTSDHQPSPEAEKPDIVSFVTRYRLRSMCEHITNLPFKNTEFDDQSLQSFTKFDRNSFRNNSSLNYHQSGYIPYFTRKIVLQLLSVINGATARLKLVDFIKDYSLAFAEEIEGEEDLNSALVQISNNNYGELKDYLFGGKSNVLDENSSSCVIRDIQLFPPSSSIPRYHYLLQPLSENVPERRKMIYHLILTIAYLLRHDKKFYLPSGLYFIANKLLLWNHSFNISLALNKRLLNLNLHDRYRVYDYSLTNVFLSAERIDCVTGYVKELLDIVMDDDIPCQQFSFPSSVPNLNTTSVTSTSEGHEDGSGRSAGHRLKEKDGIVDRKQWEELNEQRQENCEKLFLRTVFFLHNLLLNYVNMINDHCTTGVSQNNNVSCASLSDSLPTISSNGRLLLPRHMRLYPTSEKDGHEIADRTFFCQNLYHLADQLLTSYNMGNLSMHHANATFLKTYHEIFNPASKEFIEEIHSLITRYVVAVGKQGGIKEDALRWLLPIYQIFGEEKHISELLLLSLPVEVTDDSETQSTSTKRVKTLQFIRRCPYRMRLVSELIDKGARWSGASLVLVVQLIENCYPSVKQRTRQHYHHLFTVALVQQQFSLFFFYLKQRANQFIAKLTHEDSNTDDGRLGVTEMVSSFFMAMCSSNIEDGKLLFALYVHELSRPLQLYLEKYSPSNFTRHDTENNNIVDRARARMSAIIPVLHEVQIVLCSIAITFCIYFQEIDSALEYYGIYRYFVTLFSRFRDIQDEYDKNSFEKEKEREIEEFDSKSEPWLAHWSQDFIDMIYQQMLKVTSMHPEQYIARLVNNEVEVICMDNEEPSPTMYPTIDIYTLLDNNSLKKMDTKIYVNGNGVTASNLITLLESPLWDIFSIPESVGNKRAFTLGNELIDRDTLLLGNIFKIVDSELRKYQQSLKEEAEEEESFGKKRGRNKNTAFPSKGFGGKPKQSKNPLTPSTLRRTDQNQLEMRAFKRPYGFDVFNLLFIKGIQQIPHNQISFSENSIHRVIYDRFLLLVGGLDHDINTELNVGVFLTGSKFNLYNPYRIVLKRDPKSGLKKYLLVVDMLDHNYVALEAAMTYLSNQLKSYFESNILHMLTLSREELLPENNPPLPVKQLPQMADIILPSQDGFTCSSSHFLFRRQIEVFALQECRAQVLKVFESADTTNDRTHSLNAINGKPDIAYDSEELVTEDEGIVLLVSRNLEVVNRVIRFFREKVSQSIAPQVIPFNKNKDRLLLADEHPGGTNYSIAEQQIVKVVFSLGFSVDDLLGAFNY